jgi:hypothetical protein
MKKNMLLRALLIATLLLLSGCEIPGLGPDPRIAKREADAKAIGSACRHGLRGIEDCYKQNEEASKSDIFTGWKDMDLYMRENKIEGVAAAVAKAAPVEEIIDAAKPKVDPKTDPKPKSVIDTKEKSVPKAPAKAGAKEAPSSN